MKRGTCPRTTVKITCCCDDAEIDPGIANGTYYVSNITVLDGVITAISGDYNPTINTLNIEGTNAGPEQDSVVILGQINGTESIGIGKGSIAGTACTAVGTDAEAVDESVAVGHSSYANTNGTAVGVSSNANSTSVAVGHSASNNFPDSVSVGASAVCRGPNSIVVGGSSNIYNDNGAKDHNIILGSEAQIGPSSGGVSPTDGNVVIGGQADSQSGGVGGTGNPNVVIGYQTAVSDGSASVVIGAGQQTVGDCDYNTIVGFNNVNGAGGGAEYNNCVLLGKDSTATADGDIWLNNGLSSGGKFFVRRPAAGTTSDLLYYDSATHEVTYGAAAGGSTTTPDQALSNSSYLLSDDFYSLVPKYHTISGTPTYIGNTPNPTAIQIGSPYTWVGQSFIPFYGKDVNIRYSWMVNFPSGGITQFTFPGTAAVDPVTTVSGQMVVNSGVTPFDESIYCNGVLAHAPVNGWHLIEYEYSTLTGSTKTVNCYLDSSLIATFTVADSVTPNRSFLCTMPVDYYQEAGTYPTPLSRLLP